MKHGVGFRRRRAGKASWQRSCLHIRTKTADRLRRKGFQLLIKLLIIKTTSSPSFVSGNWLLQLQEQDYWQKLVAMRSSEMKAAADSCKVKTIFRNPQYKQLSHPA